MTPRTRSSRPINFINAHHHRTFSTCTGRRRLFVGLWGLVMCAVLLFVERPVSAASNDASDLSITYTIGLEQLSKLGALNAKVRKAATSFFLRNGKVTIPVLLLGFEKHESPGVQRRAAKLLLKLKPTKVASLKALERVMSNSSVRKTWWASEMLAQAGPAARPFLASLLTSKTTYARGYATFALGHLQGKKAPLLKDLEVALSDSSAAVRWYAVMGINRLSWPHANVVSTLQNALKDKNKYVRYGAILGLSRLGEVSKPAWGQMWSTFVSLAKTLHVKHRLRLARAVSVIKGKTTKEIQAVVLTYKETKKKSTKKSPSKTSFRSDEQFPGRSLSWRLGGPASIFNLEESRKKGVYGLLGGSGKPVIRARGFGGSFGASKGSLLGSLRGIRGIGTKRTSFGVRMRGLGKLGTVGRGRGGGGFGYARRRRRSRVKVVMAAPVIFGALSKNIVKRVMRRYKLRFKYCYERRLLKKPTLSGSVRFFLRVNAKGRVSKAKLKRTTINDASVEKCLTRRFKYMRFPAPKGGGIVLIGQKLTFSTQTKKVSARNKRRRNVLNKLRAARRKLTKKRRVVLPGGVVNGVVGGPLTRALTPPKIGRLKKSDIVKVIRRNIRQIRYCYERSLRLAPSLKGKVVVRWMIMANGRVKGAKVASSTLKNKRVESCLLRRVLRFRFPKPKPAGLVTVRYPFIFRPSK
ncbi:MAG: hypothetical protein CL920_03435 [Deltaproteobacteria bacterium]|nr:hypothetical protein [Deltaproteobacteria bacterium]